MSFVYINCSEYLNLYLLSFNVITDASLFLVFPLDVCLDELVKYSN